MIAGVPSVVRWPDGRETPDRNGFVTALAVRELRRCGRPVPPPWLDLLERCRRTEGGFGFWPVGGTPDWAPPLPADSDDTAVMLLELFLAGRVGQAQARRSACHAVGRHRLRHVLVPGPPWLRRGMFATWHRPGRVVDVVDLTAVVNALALLYAVGLAGIPGTAESLQALDAAAAWAQGSPVRWRSVSPFYPEPGELARALDHAADHGVPGVTRIAAAVRRDLPRQSSDAVCSMAYGPPTWHSPALAALRNEPGTVLGQHATCAAGAPPGATGA